MCIGSTHLPGMFFLCLFSSVVFRNAELPETVRQINDVTGIKNCCLPLAIALHWNALSRFDAAANQFNSNADAWGWQLRIENACSFRLYLKMIKKITILDLYQVLGHLQWTKAICSECNAIIFVYKVVTLIGIIGRFRYSLIDGHKLGEKTSNPTAHLMANALQTTIGIIS